MTIDLRITPKSIFLILLVGFQTHSQASALSNYDPELYDITLADDRAHIHTVYTSITGVAIATTTGTMSLISSLLIIYVILKSVKGLHSVYHRIMIMLSLFDVMISIAMAITTLPMPKDMIYQQFEGPIFGNTTTCSAQGFFFMFGSSSVMMYNCVLMVYYLLSIRYKMTDQRISKFIEPILHGLCLVYSLSVSVSLLVFQAYNPTPFDVWCTAITLPWWCPGIPDEPCLLRTKTSSYIVRHAMGISFILIALVMTGSLVLVVWTIYRQEYLFIKYTKRTRASSWPNADQLNLDFTFTKQILKQALAYTLAYLSVSSFGVISIVSGRPNNFVLSILHLLIRPSQGVFNFFIFMHHKVNNLRRDEPEKSIRDAIRQIFQGAEEPEQIISTLFLVRNDNETQEGADVEHKAPSTLDRLPSEDENVNSVNDLSGFKSYNSGKKSIRHGCVKLTSSRNGNANSGNCEDSFDEDGLSFANDAGTYGKDSRLSYSDANSLK